MTSPDRGGGNQLGIFVLDWRGTHLLHTGIQSGAQVAANAQPPTWRFQNPVSVVGVVVVVVVVGLLVL
jgi:hypothetical protein